MRASFILPLFLLATMSTDSYGRAWRRSHLEIPTSAPANPVIGKNGLYRLGQGETLVELAYRTGTGYQALVAANPEVDPWIPPAGHDVVLPYAAVLPPGTGPGITINLAEFRLYYVWSEKGRTKVLVYPVGVGVDGWETPEREFKVTGKVRNPSWTAPPSIREERPDEPHYIPPGPDNPLGEYWIQLGDGYGIHGTNRPFGVGRRVSHGCLRLYPEHIRDLFQRVPLGTPVRVIYRPIKVGQQGNTLVVEVHRDYMNRVENPLEEAVSLKRSIGWKEAVDLSTLAAALRDARGVPVPVSRR